MIFVKCFKFIYISSSKGFGASFDIDANVPLAITGDGQD